MKKMTGTELIGALCAEFGPSGCEDNVAALIESQLAGFCETRRDRMGNVIAHLPGEGARVMLSAHMDEAGLMIHSVDDKGYLRFSTVGALDPRVLCGRCVTVGNAENRIAGVIGAKPIHLQSADERKQVTAVSAMYIDIGATSAEEAEKYVDIGDYAVFEGECSAFGEEGRRLCGKALDNRLGCAALIEIIRAAADRPLSCDLWAVFSVREEIGRSGTGAAAYAIRPDYTVVLDAAEVYDLPDGSKTGGPGQGVLVSLSDRGTIYDARRIDYVLALGREMEIAVGIHRGTALANDAAQVQRTADGAAAIALSLPVRYPHSAASIADTRDYAVLCRLVGEMLVRKDAFPKPIDN